MSRSRMRTVLFLLLSAGVMSVILAAQERVISLKIVKIDYKMDELVQPSTLSDDQLSGRALWLQRCAFCHDGVGTPTYNTLGPWLDSEIVKARGDAAVRAKILTGSTTMPGFQHGLTPSQVEQLIAFLKTVSPNQKPTPEQRAGKATPPGDV